MEDKFILYTTRKPNQYQFRMLRLTEKSYATLQRLKEKAGLPIYAIAEMAIDYALNHMEIRYVED